MNEHVQPHREQAAVHLAIVEDGLAGFIEEKALETNLRLAQVHAILHVGEKLDELTRLLEGEGR